MKQIAQNPELDVLGFSQWMQGKQIRFHFIAQIESALAWDQSVGILSIHLSLLKQSVHGRIQKYPSSPYFRV